MIINAFIAVKCMTQLKKVMTAEEVARQRIGNGTRFVQKNAKKQEVGS